MQKTIRSSRNAPPNHNHWTMQATGHLPLLDVTDMQMLKTPIANIFKSDKATWNAITLFKKHIVKFAETSKNLRKLQMTLCRIMLCIKAPTACSGWWVWESIFLGSPGPRHLKAKGSRELPNVQNKNYWNQYRSIAVELAMFFFRNWTFGWNTIDHIFPHL